MRRLFNCLAACALLTGCDSLKPDTSSLLASGSTPQQRIQCDACHGFAPHTGAHRYHLDTSFQITYPTTAYGRRRITTDVQITCADCHASSIATVSGVVDSIYKFPDRSAQFHTAGWPYRPFQRDSRYLVDTVTVDSVPLAYASRADNAENPFFVTKSATNPGFPGHANGSMDVVFPERDAYWKGSDGIVHKATYNALRLSCAAVACHGSQSLDDSIRYTWRQP